MSPFAQTSTLTVSSNNRSFRLWFSSHLTAINIASFSILFILCLIYIVQVNQTVSKGYQIRDLESQIHELTLVNQKLELSTQQAQSLENVARATKMIGLIRADRPEYLQSGTPSYALAN